MKKYFLIVVLAFVSGVFFSTTASAQLAYDYDWANFNRYEAANEQVDHRPFAVLMGDSISDNWDRFDLEFFTENNILGRGISGQTTSQMLVRFRKDVVAHHPKYALIMAGTNDIAHNTGFIALDNIVGNIISMCEIAKTNNIKPVIISITPSNSYPWRRQVQNVAESIKEVNAQLQVYAKDHHYKYIDLHTPLQDEDGGLPEKYSHDGVHPNLDCYKIMEEIVLKALRQYMPTDRREQVVAHVDILS